MYTALLALCHSSMVLAGIHLSGGMDPRWSLPSNGLVEGGDDNV